MAPAPPPPPREGPPVDSGGCNEEVAAKADKLDSPTGAVRLGFTIGGEARANVVEAMECGNLAQEPAGPVTRSRSNPSVTVVDAITAFVRPSESSTAGRKKRRLTDGTDFDSADSHCSSVEIEVAGSSAKKGKAVKGAAKVALTKNRRREFLKDPGSDSEGDEDSEPLPNRSGLKTPRNKLDPAEIQIQGVRDALVDRAIEALGVVKKSGNLKGTCKKQLKDALDKLASLADSLNADLIPRAVTPLLKRNSDIQAELQTLRKENEELRARIASGPPAPPLVSLRPTPAYNQGVPGRGNDSDWDVFRSQIMEDVGRMMKRQTAELMRHVKSMVTPQRIDVDVEEDVPSYAYRPPLQNGERIEAYRQEGNIRPGVPPQTEVANAAKGASRRKGAKATQSQPTQARKSGQGTASQQSSPAVESWATVVKKNGRVTSVPEAKAGPSGVQGKGKGGSQSQAQSSQKKGKGAPAPSKLRAPRSAAVILAIPPEAEKAGANYASILREAKSKIDLASMGIEELRFKSAATGARILEIPGSQSGDKADALAQKLREVLGENPVQVSRPTKTAEMRIMGLDDSVTTQDIAEAVARDGECVPDEVKAGEIRLNPSGLGTCWVRAPILVVKKITTAARIKVGWVSAPVELLRQRPLRCFKCLQTGHVRMRCPHEGDRSGLCFRCSKSGHKAAGCKATPCCAICREAGKPAEHWLGSKNCSPGRQQARKGPAPAPPATAAVPTSNSWADLEEEMDI
ncbi:uncharacterized protein LOC131854540 [Achroia grisella]|uniref:uncharacterized protein LOC131854540 n=1 Tax=Achroia grisella TaxID=688607 RepID=UPI0027D2BC06|nr:uncharacterized protein LOC131854540 [Achroia grisella]